MPHLQFGAGDAQFTAPTAKHSSRGREDDGGQAHVAEVILCDM